MKKRDVFEAGVIGTLIFLTCLVAFSMGLSCNEDYARTTRWSDQSVERAKFRRDESGDGPWIEDEHEYGPNHNKYGGYIPACGELPPLVGDDC